MCAYCVYYQIVTHWTIFNTTYGVCFLIFNHCVLLHVHTRKYHLHIYNIYNSLYQFKQIETLKRFPVISQGGLIMACGRWGGTTAPPWLILYPLKKPIKSSHFCLYQVITPQIYKKSFRSLIRTLWCYMLVIYIQCIYIYIFTIPPVPHGFLHRNCSERPSPWTRSAPPSGPSGPTSWRHIPSRRGPGEAEREIQGRPTWLFNIAMDQIHGISPMFSR